jgi:hypothetical protein
MKYKTSDKIRKGSKVTLTSSLMNIPKGSLGKVIEWTYERYWNGVFHTRHLVEFTIKNKNIQLYIPTRLLKK